MNSDHYSCIMCTTIWDAVLKVNNIKDDSICISDPNARDAGMYIEANEIKCLWKITLYSDCPHPQYSNKEWAKIRQYF